MHTHKFIPSEEPEYGVCTVCGTYKSLSPMKPSEIYKNDYWSSKWGHSSIIDQRFNVDKHLENGLSKNQFTASLIKIERRGSAMEIGCAPGGMLRAIHQAGFDPVIGIEVDNQYEKDILEECPEARLAFGFFPQCTSTMPDESIDLIVAMDVFEHMEDPIGFLKECARLMDSGGQLILMLPIMQDGFDKRFFHPAEHVLLHTRESIDELLKETGFKPALYNQWTTGHETVSTYKS